MGEERECVKKENLSFMQSLLPLFFDYKIIFIFSYMNITLFRPIARCLRTTIDSDVLSRRVS